MPLSSLARIGVGAVLLAAFLGCQSEDLICAGVGGPGSLRLQIVDRQTRTDLTARSTVTVRDLRSGNSLSGLGNDPLRATDEGSGRWTILVELVGYQSRQDTVLLAGRDPCDRNYTPPTYRMELDRER